MTLGAIRWSLRSNDVAGMQTNLAWETLLDLPAHRAGLLHMRLAAAIRTAIRDGRIPREAALPPSRTLAADLGVSRWTVTQAYAQLVTEGYLTARTGSATRVSWAPRPGLDEAADLPVRPPEAVPDRPPRFDLSSARPDLRAFPRRKWVEAIRTAAETATISVFSGVGQGMSQVSHALLADGQVAIGLEDPGSSRLWQAARSAGLELIGLPVDEDGLVVDQLEKYPGLRAVCVGAARQVATGCVLAPHRRSALLDWARRVDGLVVEDDFDSEFSYGRPAPAVMQGTD